MLTNINIVFGLIICLKYRVYNSVTGNYIFYFSYCNHRIMKFSSKGQLLEVWQVAVAGLKLFIPHKAILNVAEDILYVADRENGRIISYNTSSGGRGSVFCGSQELQGYPYAVYFNSSESDWPMYGVYGRAEKNEDVMGFSIDKNGRKISTWGPDEVWLCHVIVM